MLYKYPRSMHLPWSPGSTKDDRILKDVEHFQGKEVVVTEKMDGENTSMYRDAIHARSLSSGDHPSRAWVKGLWGAIRHNIPEGWRICGENLYAVHSIQYTDLKTWFKVFSIWDETNKCLSWEETLEWCELLELTPVTELYSGLFDLDKIKSCWSPELSGRESEGYDVRLKGSFLYENFNKSLGKYVRENHVKSDEHWMRKPIVENGL